ncbi:MAG: CBS domain-containing protein [Isosphaeraceae bacterium]
MNDDRNATLTAAEVMNASPRTCSRFSKVIEAVLIFKDEDCGMVPVVEEGKPIGVVTDRDVALALATYADLVDRPIEGIMNTGIISVLPSAPVSEVVETMGRESVRRVLVVDEEEGLLRGVISWKDVSGELPDRAVGRVVSEIVESPAT